MISPADARPRHLVAVLVAIWQADTVLLVQSRFPDAPWGLPGGLLEHGETVEQAAVREVWEETGLIIQPTRVTGFYSVASEGALAIILAANVIGGVLLQSTAETQAAAYFPKDALPAVMRPNHRERVLDATNSAALPFSRAQ